MSYRTTGVLLALLLVLGGVVYYLLQQPSPDELKAKANTPQVVSFSPTDANTVVLTAADKTTEVQKNGTLWTLAQPETGPADNGRVEGWVDQIGNLTADRAIDNVSDLSTYGLTQPKLNVEVDLTGGKSVKLQFGDKTPDGGDYYVRMPDDAAKAKSVYLVGASLGDDLISALTKPPKALPTPTPLPTLVPVSPSALAPIASTPITTVTPGG